MLNFILNQFNLDTFYAHSHIVLHGSVQDSDGC